MFDGPNYGKMLAQARAQNAMLSHPQSGGSNGNRKAITKVHSSSVSGASNAGGSGAIICAVTASTHTFYASAAIPGGITFSVSAGESEPTKPVESAGIKLGEIIGWRMWNYYKGYLRSFSADRIWAPEERMTGEPSDNGSDGIWAFKEKNRALKKMLEGSYNNESVGTVYGSVKLWGKIVEHELGYRAECAKIVSLEDVYIQQGDKQQILKDLRKQYSLVSA